MYNNITNTIQKQYVSQKRFQLVGKKMDRCGLVLRIRHIVNRCSVTVWPGYGSGKMTRWDGENTKWQKCEGY